MSIVNLYRKDNQPYAQIPNEAIRDPRITPNAFRLLAYLMSHKDGYELNYDQIEAQTTLGRFAINQSAKLLEELGWLLVDRPKLANGQFGCKSWTVLNPCASTTVGHSTMESPHMESPTDYIRKPSIKENYELRTLAQNAFERFWNVYPRKVGKEAARKVFDKISVDVIEFVITGAFNLANDPNLPSTQFVPYPATWLNRTGWEDEPYPERLKTAEELAVIQAEKNARIREATILETQERMKEAEEARKRSTPPPTCEHGISIIKCRSCLLGLN